MVLERQRLKAREAGEGFVPGAHDNIPDLDSISKELPHWSLAILPLALVIGVILAPRLVSITGFGDTFALVALANSQPILWPSIALLLASFVGVLLFSTVRNRPLKVLGDGTQDSIIPLLATAAVIGFGGVVVQTSGFSAFTSAVVGADIPPLLSAFAAISVVSGITGSASGGIQIFMETVADKYLAMGIDPDELHRLVAMASGGFDSLPHCGAIIAMLTITGLTHKEAYRDVGIITVIIPVIATLASAMMATKMQ